MSDAHDLNKLIRFLHRDEDWQGCLDQLLDEHLLPALDVFDLDLEALGELLGADNMMILWGCAFEDLLTQRWEPDGDNIVDIYLKRRGWSEKVLAKAYMTGLRDSHVSLYEVSDIEPGKSMRLRDMLTDAAPVIVREKSASRSLAQWDRIAVRVIPVRDHHVISGGLLPFSRDAAEFLIDGLRNQLKLKKSQKLRMTAEQLQNCAPIFTSAWLLTRLPQLLEPQLPELKNSDGHDLLFHEICFPLARGIVQKEIAAALDKVQELHPEGAKFWNWVDPAQPGSRPVGNGLSLSSFTEQGTILGTLELKGKALTLQVNSAERAKRGIAMIETAAGDLLGPPLTSIQSFEQLQADHDAGPDDDTDEISPEIAALIGQQVLDRHYRDTLDQPIPALGNKSPRAAVKTAAGRQKVIDWLKQLENNHARGGNPAMTSYDSTWMWTELGLEKQRR